MLWRRIIHKKMHTMLMIHFEQREEREWTWWEISLEKIGNYSFNSKQCPGTYWLSKSFFDSEFLYKWQINLIFEELEYAIISSIYQWIGGKTWHEPSSHYRDDGDKNCTTFRSIIVDGTPLSNRAISFLRLRARSITLSAAQFSFFLSLSPRSALDGTSNFCS